MKRFYEAPEAEIEKFTLTTSVFTASDGGIEDGDNDYDDF